jgi:hypothetical protein
MSHCRNNSLIIVEDADNILGSKFDRNSTVTKILNFASGPVETNGLFVLSTNLEHADIDPAFTRDGRMLARIPFCVFTRDEARQWLSDKKHATELDKETYTLANLYAMANDCQKMGVMLDEVGIGFDTTA